MQRVRRLFIEATGYEDTEIRSIIENIAKSPRAEHEFKFILNRCCHILINRWQMQPQFQSAIPELVALFDQIPPSGSTYNRGARQIRTLTKRFTQTEQYLTLQRLGRVISETTAKKHKPELVGNLISRYPYLHEHCLLSEDSSYEHQQTVRQIQSRIQHDFELDLSQYVTYQVRLAQVARQRQSLSKAKRLVEPVENPTLLSDRELGAALKQFVGKVDRNCTYRDLAQSFLSHSQHLDSYEVFKDDLYEYLTSSIDPAYGNRQFNQRLYKQLQNTLPHCDSQKPSEFLTLRTASQLLNFLVVESPQRPNHYVFVDMITNLGATSTIGLLLKVVLLCRKVKPYLEKRFSILFSHYESSSPDGVPWLVKSLDNLHLAFSIHFGSVDLSYLKQIM